MSKKIALFATTISLNISLLLLMCSTVYADVIYVPDHDGGHSPMFLILAAVLVLIVVIIAIAILRRIMDK